jgi:nicotinamide-nucleotide amidase
MDPSSVHAIDGSPDESHYAFQGREGGEDVHSLISLCQAVLRRRRQTIAFAESVSGGMLADLWSGEPDGGQVFFGGVVATGGRALVELLDIPEVFLQNFSAASREVAQAMAAGLWRRLDVDFTVALAGVAERGHGSPARPAGLVWLAIRTPTREIVQRLDFSSCAAQRHLIRERACYAACKIFLQVLFEEEVGQEPPIFQEMAEVGVKI